MTPIQLSLVVHEVSEILKRTLSLDIHLKDQVAEDLWLVNADPSQISQVLMNLALNARDAMPQGGRLDLEAENVHIEDGPTDGPGRRRGSFVRLRVKDTGEGIETETMKRIFEPFFTTKPAGKGTGLGLAMAFGIVQQHHGWIECHSKVGEGATFDVYLPRWLGDSIKLSLVSGPLEAQTLLFVDDEPALRAVGREWLTSAGYRVLLAGDGLEAVNIFKQEPKIDLVLLDRKMPRLDGRETLAQLRKLKPDVQVLFVGGISPDENDDGSLGFLQKPYSEKVLLSAVKTALSRVARPVY